MGKKSATLFAALGGINAILARNNEAWDKLFGEKAEMPDNGRGKRLADLIRSQDSRSRKAIAALISEVAGVPINMGDDEDETPSYPAGLIVVFEHDADDFGFQTGEPVVVTDDGDDTAMQDDGDTNQTLPSLEDKKEVLKQIRAANAEEIAKLSADQLKLLLDVHTSGDEDEE